MHPIYVIIGRLSTMQPLVDPMNCTKMRHSPFLSMVPALKLVDRVPRHRMIFVFLTHRVHTRLWREIIRKRIMLVIFMDIQSMRDRTRFIMMGRKYSCTCGIMATYLRIPNCNGGYYRRVRWKTPRYKMDLYRFMDSVKRQWGIQRIVQLDGGFILLICFNSMTRLQ